MRINELPIGDEGVPDTFRDGFDEWRTFGAMVLTLGTERGLKLQSVTNGPMMWIEDRDACSTSPRITRGVIQTPPDMLRAIKARLDGRDHWPDAGEVGPCPFTYPRGGQTIT